MPCTRPSFPVVSVCLEFERPADSLAFPSFPCAWGSHREVGAAETKSACALSSSAVTDFPMFPGFACALSLHPCAWSFRKCGFLFTYQRLASPRLLTRLGARLRFPETSTLKHETLRLAVVHSPPSRGMRLKFVPEVRALELP